MRAWPVIPLLADGFRVVAVDLRGHGRSDRPGIYSLELMRDEVVGVLDELKLSGVTPLGHSLGGAVAYLVAAARPGLVRRLVVEDACPPYPRDATVPDRPASDLAFDWDLVARLRAQLNAPTRRYWPGLADIAAPTLVIGGGPPSTIPHRDGDPGSEEGCPGGRTAVRWLSRRWRSRSSMWVSTAGGSIRPCRCWASATVRTGQPQVTARLRSAW